MLFATVGNAGFVVESSFELFNRVLEKVKKDHAHAALVTLSGSTRIISCEHGKMAVKPVNYPEVQHFLVAEQTVATSPVACVVHVAFW